MVADDRVRINQMVEMNECEHILIQNDDHSRMMRKKMVTALARSDECLRYRVLTTVSVVAVVVNNVRFLYLGQCHLLIDLDTILC